MTKLEAAAIVHAADPGIKMEFRLVEGDFVALKAHPCPLYLFKRCSVYAARPYNCRRFACLRPDPTSEPWEDPANWEHRVRTSRIARRLMTRIQRKAQPWARKMGWKV